MREREGGSMGRDGMEERVREGKKRDRMNDLPQLLSRFEFLWLFRAAVAHVEPLQLRSRLLHLIQLPWARSGYGPCVDRGSARDGGPGAGVQRDGRRVG